MGLGLLLLVLSQAQPTEAYIKAFRPDISPRRAQQLGRKIDAAAIKYGQDSCLMAALARVESNYDSDLIMCWPADWGGYCHWTCDRGVGEINEVWIKPWGLSPWRLQHDDGYNFMVMARLLKQLKAQHPDDPKWFLYYHNRLPDYQARYMVKLKPFLDQCTDATLASGDPHDPERPNPD